MFKLLAKCVARQMKLNEVNCKIQSQFQNPRQFSGPKSNYEGNSDQKSLKINLSPVKDFLANEKKVDVDGIQINVLEVGEGPQTVLCLPGSFGSIGSDFGPLLSQMDHSSFRWVFWDPPGYGKSRPPKRDFGGNYLKRDALTAANLMSKLGHEKYSCMGWSKGGNTALLLAIHFPSSVKKLVTFGATSFMDPHALNYTRMFSDFDKWSRRQKEAMLAMYEEDYIRQSLKDLKNAYEKRYEENYFFFNDDDLRQIQSDSLVIHGASDVIVKPTHAHHLAEYLPNSTLHLIPDATHYLHLTHTKEFLDVVHKFLVN